MSYRDSKGRYLCVFWQDEKGIIRESLFLRDEKHWRLIRTIFVTDGAKLESPLTAILWANGVEKRLFYLDQSNLIREVLCSDGFSWAEDQHNGLTPLKIATHHQSGLIAGHNRTREEEWRRRVYQQNEHLQLQELKFDSCHRRWVHGYKELPHALPGSVLAFGAHTNSTFLHLYYQKQDSQPAEIYYMPWWWLNPLNMWFHGAYRPVGNYPNRTAIACIIRERHFSEGHFRIFCHEGSGIISETICWAPLRWAPLIWAPTTRLPIKFPNASHFVALEWMEPDVQEGWQQHIVGINTADGTIWDYITGSEKVGPQISLFDMAI
ncbi:hypothetical protein L211DRAFT_836645 [Terfezia boudieri ATCC MYA-4762]|uniref:Uncharacterized protein n=1 Tax=Terfezia boudieri ATCC MYA-4762 TaxID=1051890 RepID=A0A3N4M4Y0_9PEZI|nr:hypothetical protein L211DRAFT_836645 [Terfezia boudieri ATCC MYA-4762]